MCAQPTRVLKNLLRAGHDGELSEPVSVSIGVAPSVTSEHSLLHREQPLRSSQSLCTSASRALMPPSRRT
ncbi:MAG: hypothetical protein DWH97_07865 [Planctomycetota bacterium]|nr:MAG: hypothetical protein DWH97_07865 [Planctomycetota bacterium]RLS92773.1 MAG: hypothetical protein DWI12_10495 [Planctomycetota bacterium]